MLYITYDVNSISTSTCTPGPCQPQEARSPDIRPTCHRFSTDFIPSASLSYCRLASKDGIMRSPVRTIAIIGGGFSGSVLAARLLRRPPAEPSRIVLIERRAQLGRGVAYQATVHQPLLNVPAGRMSADPA